MDEMKLLTYGAQKKLWDAYFALYTCGENLREKEKKEGFWNNEDGIGVVEIILILVDNYVSLFNYLYCLLCYYIYEIKKSIYISYPIHPINQFLYLYQSK